MAGSLWVHLLRAQIICSCKAMHVAQGTHGERLHCSSLCKTLICSQLHACLLLLGKPCVSILLPTLCLTRVFHSRVPSKS